ncbi:MAG: carboxypeptidase regulatory-like domain-containing protein [Longimicrobiales bacterium]
MIQTMLPALVVALATQMQQAAVTGIVRDAQTGAPVASAIVTLADVGRIAATDAEGRYRFTGVPSGPQHLAIERIGYAARTLHALVPGEGQLRIDASIEPVPVALGAIEVRGGDRLTSRAGGAYRADRTVALPMSRSHSRFDEADALAALAGGAVASEPELPAGLSVRGGAADHTAFVLDGVPVLSPYHAAGVFGAWNPAALSDVSLVSISPAPKLPHALSGTVEARTRTPGSRLGARFGVSTSQTSVTADGPLFASGAGYLVSFRRTFAGSAFRPAEDSYLDGNGSDWLVKLAWPAGNGSLDLIGFGNANEFDASATLTDSLDASTERNEFEWYGRSLGARYEKWFDRTLFRAMVWHATADASARWNVDRASWDDLSSSHANTGAMASVQFGDDLRGSLVGVRWTRLDGDYAVRGSMPFARDGSIRFTTAIAQRHGRLGRLRYDFAISLAPVLDTIRASPQLRLDYPVSPALNITIGLGRSHQYAQSLRNPESVVGAIFPADLLVAAGSGVPVAFNDQAVVSIGVQPAPALRVTAEAFTRRLNGLALVASREAEPYARDGVATGRGSVRGISLDLSLDRPRYGIIASYAWQTVRYGDGSAGYTPTHAAQHRFEAGTIVFPSATSSLRAGVSAALGRRATPIEGAIEWESCNLLDRGCELAGSPDVSSEPRGSDRLPAYVRADLGARKHWHFRVARANTQIAIFATLTNLFGRRNVLRTMIDPLTGERSILGMRPFSPLTIGLDWRW